MTRTIHPVDATAGAPVYNGRMLRQIESIPLAGATAADPFGSRPGVRPGTSVTTVTATSTQWSVGPHAGVLDYEAALESGTTTYAIDAAVTGTLRAADAFARVDLIWVRQDIPLEDGSAVPDVVPGYTFGTVAGTPPALPARCLLLAWVNVPASGGGSPTVTWKAPYLAAAGVLEPAVVAQITVAPIDFGTAPLTFVTAPTVTGDGVKKYKITFTTYAIRGLNTTDTFDLMIQRNGTTIGGINTGFLTTGFANGKTVVIYDTPPAGATTYSAMGARSSGTGYATLFVTASVPTQVIVEQIA